MSLPDIVIPSTPPSSPTMGVNTGPNRTTTTNEYSPVLINRDRAMDANQVLQREDHSRTNSLPRPPTRRGSDNIIPTDHSCMPANPPIFGSTSHKQGMNEAMAKLNLSHKDDPPRIAAAEDHDKKKKTGLQTMFRLPFERKLTNPIRGPEYQRINTTLTCYSNDTQPQSQAQVRVQVQNQAEIQVQCQTQPQSNSNSQPQNPPEKEKQPSPPPPPPPPPPQQQQHQQHKPKDQPPLPAISELPELLQETDAACRRASSQEQYWSSETHQALWQRLLVAKLVRAKHARLDATQSTAMRYARRLSGAEQLETWYRLRTMRKTRAEKARGKKTKTKKEKEEKEKKTRQQRKEEKRRVAEELERRRKQEEAVRVVRRLLELREGKRGQDYGLLAAMSYDGEIPR